MVDNHHRAQQKPNHVDRSKEGIDTTAPSTTSSSSSSSGSPSGEGDRGFLKGTVVCFVGFSGAKRVELWNERLSQYQGVVFNLKKWKANVKGKGSSPPSLKRPAPSPPEAFPLEVTHIVVPKDYPNSLTSLLKALSASSIGPDTKVVKENWMVNCLQKRSLISPESYQLIPDDMVASMAKEDDEAPGSAEKKARVEREGSEGGGGGPAASASASAGEEEAVAGEQGGTWEDLGLDRSVFYYRSARAHVSSEKVAAFDLDDTLIESKSGQTFSHGPTDYKWAYGNVRKKLKAVYDEGYRVVIISNQKGVELGKVRKETLVQKVTNVIRDLVVPVEVYLASRDDIYRKPRTGIWDLLVASHAVDLKGSFYVGNAAGRYKTKDQAPDHSAGDVKFAVNVGIKFMTPEEYFQGSQDKKNSGEACRRVYEAMPLTNVLSPDEQPPPISIPEGQEAIVLVGPAASGKSTFCSRLPDHYVRVNQDTLKTKDKCKAMAVEVLGQGKSVVIDNTNVTAGVRKEWVELFRNSSLAPQPRPLRVRCIVLDFPKEVCLHLNACRRINPYGKERRAVPEAVIHRQFNQLQEIQEGEGFDVVEKVDRIYPGMFSCEAEKKLFLGHVMEKKVKDDDTSSAPKKGGGGSSSKGSLDAYFKRA